ncbi:MAG: tetratricopeptide repeat protein [Methylococcaceae bacterium]
MIDFHHHEKIMLVAVLAFSALLLLEGCSKEEDSKDHLQKGIEYLNKGDYEKAKLELKTSSQAGKDTAETYYYMALLDEKNRRFKGMKENLIKTIELAPTYTDARLKLGKVDLLFGEIDAALEQAEFILKDSSQNLDALALKASALNRQKKQAEALAIIDSILKVKPDHTDALTLKSVIYMEKGDFNEALALIESAKKSDSNNISLDLFKIQLDAKTKNVDAVIGDYKKLVASHPDNNEFKITLAKIYVGVGKIKEAEELLRGLVDAEPNKISHKLLLLDFLSTTAREKVSEQFHQFTEQHKNQPRMLLDLSNWMIARKNYDEAKKVLNRVIDLEETSNVGLLAKTILAKIAFENQDLDEAAKIIDEILEDNSNYDEAKILQARLLLVKEQYDEAIAVLNKVIWSKSDSEEALLLLGQAFLITGDQIQADKYFSNVLAVNPANLQAVTYAYDKAMKSNDIKYAKAILEKALTRVPENIDLLEKLAKVEIAQKNWDAAKSVTQKISTTPHPLANDLAKYLLGQILQGQGDCAKAVGFYKEILIKFPENSDALGNMARCYELMAKRNEMIVFLNDMLAKNSRNIPAAILLGDLYVLDKKLDKASAVIKSQIKDNGKIAQLYTSLASIKLAQNDINGAIEVYQEGLKLNPDNIKLSLALASLYERQNKYDSAVALYEELLDKNPRLEPAINNLSLLLSEHYSSPEKLKKAVQLAEKFKDSSQPYFKDTYAWALIKQGSIREGLDILNKIVITSPDIPVFRYHLGVANYKNGNSGSAISDLKYSLELGKKTADFPDKQAAEMLLEEIIADTRSH